MLPDVDGSANRGFAVEEKVEGERQMAAAVGNGVDRLDEPLADADKVLTQETLLDQIVKRLEQQRPTLVSKLAVLPAAAVSALELVDQTVQVGRLGFVPEHPQLLAVRRGRIRRRIVGTLGIGEK